jgi:hypothetical protein
VKALLCLVVVAGLCPPALAGPKGRPVVLFDGHSLDAWTTTAGKPVTAGWAIEPDGTLHRKGRGGHLLTKESFGDFELRFEWKLAPGANSGVKYHVNWHGKQPLGCEYQLIDDKRVKNARTSTTSCAALYQLYAPDADKPLKPPGEFNRARIVVRGGHIEHWLNGKKVLEAEAGGEEWKARIARSKFRRVKGFGLGRGKILLQDHGGEVWFRNIVLVPK